MLTSSHQGSNMPFLSSSLRSCSFSSIKLAGEHCLFTVPYLWDSVTLSSDEPLDSTILMFQVEMYPKIMWFTMLTCFTGGVAGNANVVMKVTGAPAHTVIAFSYLLIILYALTLAPICWVYAAEVWSLETRATGMGIAGEHPRTFSHQFQS